LTGRAYYLFSACVLLGWASPVQAEPVGVHLVWERPAGSTCPPGVVLEHDVEEALGRRVFTSADKADVIVRGAIEKLAGGLHVWIEARSAAGSLLGKRELSARADECESLRSVVAVVLTLLVDRDDVDVDSPVTLDVGAAVGVLTHAFPRPAFGVGPLLAINFAHRLSLSTAVSYWLPVAVETARGTRAKLEAVGLALGVCPRLWNEARSWHVRLCAGAQLGALIASQQRPERLGTQTRLLAQGSLELQGGLNLGSTLGLELAVGPVLALNRTQFLAVNADEPRVVLYRQPAIGLKIQLALIIRGS
jgi:hypothetical protein